MPEVNGKDVVFCEKLEAAKWWDLLPALASLQQSEGDGAEAGLQALRDLGWEQARALIAGTVETYGGEAVTEELLDESDIFHDAIPLLMLVAQRVGEQATDLGEAESAST
jgi:hypothetical protein